MRRVAAHLTALTLQPAFLGSAADSLSLAGLSVAAGGCLVLARQGAAWCWHGRCWECWPRSTPPPPLHSQRAMQTVAAARALLLLRLFDAKARPLQVARQS